MIHNSEDENISESSHDTDAQENSGLGKTSKLPPPTDVDSHANFVKWLTNTHEESEFEQIFLALTKAFDAALFVVSVARRQFEHNFNLADENRTWKSVQDLWSALINQCGYFLNVSEALKIRLVNPRLDDPASRIELFSVEALEFLYDKLR